MSVERNADGTFKRGSSGNKSGRPSGSKNHKTWFLDIVGEPVAVTINGRKKKLPRIAVMYMTHMNKAASGNVQSARFIASERDRLGVLDEFEKIVDFSRDSELLNTYRGILADPSVEPVGSDEEDDLRFLE